MNSRDDERAFCPQGCIKRRGNWQKVEGGKLDDMVSGRNNLYSKRKELDYLPRWKKREER